jgi:hypothetical protein
MEPKVQPVMEPVPERAPVRQVRRELPPPVVAVVMDRSARTDSRRRLKRSTARLDGPMPKICARVWAVSIQPVTSVVATRWAATDHWARTDQAPSVVAVAVTIQAHRRLQRWAIHTS